MPKKISQAKTLNQLEFSSILFDTLFGLVLFYSIDSFLEITAPLEFVFYLFTMLILAHWWLIYKSADDCYEEEVTRSAADLIFGIVEITLIEYIILLSKDFLYQKVNYFLISLLAVDLLWAIVWRFIGRWRTRNKQKVRFMESELNTMIYIDGITLVLFILLAIIAPMISALWFVLLFIGFYAVYIYLTFKKEVIDINIF